MKKMMTMCLAALALAIVLPGCRGSGFGSSPSDVAVDFANAIIQKNISEALDLCDIKLYNSSSHRGIDINPTVKSKSDIKRMKEKFERDGRELDDDKCEGIAIMEVITTPSDLFPIYHIDGKEYTGESAKVTVQYVKGRDKKSKGLTVSLVKVDGAWKVTGYTTESALDDDD